MSSSPAITSALTNRRPQSDRYVWKNVDFPAPFEPATAMTTGRWSRNENGRLKFRSRLQRSLVRQNGQRLQYRQPRFGGVGRVGLPQL
ncbi:hypothetical protein Pla52n_40070 [Stieleria varia]|uniref:Uncharacterized protein n=1 Tax=Stieleria varia TaxID=2528005 RepID=A0A5C6AUP0_9BACT|nr:hypothetical protein Pla52n_40070 [Stieleria varia]